MIPLDIAARTADHLREAATRVADFNMLVGFDGFVDEILHVIDKRLSADEYTTLETLADLGTRIVGAAGRSTNLELIVERVKIGGNGPIMAEALAALGFRVTCVGALGTPTLHPVFEELAQRAEVISLGDPAHTDALEFEDGKLMLGKLEPLRGVTWQALCQTVGPERLTALLTGSSAVALVNWTMLPFLSNIWEHILEMLAAVPGNPRERWYFFDLADPQKRAEADLWAALQQIHRFQAHARTILGLNEKEGFAVGRALGYAGGEGRREDVCAVAEYIERQLQLDTVVVHPRPYAVVATTAGITDVDGSYTEHPLNSTGAGGHFNTGFCLGRLLGLPDDETLSVASGVSGYYVQTGRSPSVEQAAEFIRRGGQ
jgi:sugar/nucleoside kinase (ribokinase family)